MTRLSKPFLVVLFLLVASLFSAVWPASAALIQGPVDGNDIVEDGGTLVLVPANGEASIDIRALCLDFGAPFPSQLGPILPRASEDVVRVLLAAIDLDLIEGDILQTQSALWRTADGDWPYPEGDLPRDVAQSIIDAAAAIDVPPLLDDEDVVSITDAVANGVVVAASNNWRAVEGAPSVYPGESPYAAEATILLTNQTDEDVYVYYPIGTELERTGNSSQNMITYVTGPAPVELPMTGADFGVLASVSADFGPALNAPTRTNLVDINDWRSFSLSLPAIGVASEIEPVGWASMRQPDGSIANAWEVAANAVGWHKNSALPVNSGNIVLSGHNSIDGSIFRDLDRLKVGDLAIVVYEGQVRTYRVDEVLTMPYRYASDAARAQFDQLIMPSHDDRLTLVSCYPDFRTTHRIMVVASPVTMTQSDSPIPLH